jgi:hypothetical protein
MAPRHRQARTDIRSSRVQYRNRSRQFALWNLGRCERQYKRIPYRKRTVGELLASGMWNINYKPHSPEVVLTRLHVTSHTSKNEVVPVNRDYVSHVRERRQKLRAFLTSAPDDGGQSKAKKKAIPVTGRGGP